MSAPVGARPRLGFVGVGWIGRHRLEAIAASETGEIAAVCDPVPAAVAAVKRSWPAIAVCASLAELETLELDGVVIATPSAQHADEAVWALSRGLAVFCQKPLGRTAYESEAVVRAAAAADRLLGVDLSYRHLAGVGRIRELARSSELGELFAADLVFHNAYGPDKPWFYDPRLSGGGCLVDLGIHLIDLALYVLGGGPVVEMHGRLLAHGRPLADPRREVEDYAVAELTLASGAVITLATSWNLAAGRDAIIRASFYGTRGGAALVNVGGSFYDFVAERYVRTATETLARPPDAWGGRAAVAWARALAAGQRFDPAVAEVVEVARIIDGLYGLPGPNT